MRLESEGKAAFDQRGRAGLQFLGSLQFYSSGVLLEQAQRDFEAEPGSPELAAEYDRPGDKETWQQRVERAKSIAQQVPAYRFNRFYQRYVAEENWVRALTAVERRRAQLSHFAVSDDIEPNERLILDPELQMPAYFEGVEWHLQPGGFDAYDLNGPIYFLGLVPYVFSRGGFAAVALNDDIRQQRIEALSQYRHSPIRRIYDAGSGGASSMSLLRSMSRQTEIVCGDLSAQVLIDGWRMSESAGWNISFRQEDARHVQEPDESFDAVFSYAVQHEMPQNVSREMMREMFRILEPGGEIVISDPPPFRAVGPMQSAILEWETDYRAEPYFTEACLLNLAEVLSEAGFVEVQEYALQDEGYPWITRGIKP